MALDLCRYVTLFLFVDFVIWFYRDKDYIAMLSAAPQFLLSMPVCFVIVTTILIYLIAIQVRC